MIGPQLERLRVGVRPAANRLLVSLLGVVLLALLILQIASAVLFALLSFNVSLPAGPIFDLVHPVHFFVGFVLIPLVLLKLMSTGWKFVMYYLGSRAYHEVGPPDWPARLIAPLFVVSSIVLLGSGIEMWSFLNQFIGFWTQVHLIASVGFVGSLIAHLVFHARHAHRDAAADLAPATVERPAERGQVTRRAVVGGGLLLGAGLAISAANWPSPALSWLYQRRVGAGPLDFPIMNFEGAAQKVDVRRWRLRVTGAVTNPLVLTYDELRALPTEEHEYPLNCVTGWSATRRWRGVPLVDLLRRAGADPHFGHVQVRSTSGYHWDHNRQNVLVTGALLVTHVNGQPLSDDHGFPARLLLPGLQGQSNVKWVDQLTVGLGAAQLYVAPNIVPVSQPVTGPLLPPDPAGHR